MSKVDRIGSKEGVLRYPTTPDGRYFVVRGRLWRASNPALSADARGPLIKGLMAARRAVAIALRTNNAEDERAKRAAVERFKVALGERGQVWWDDGAPDFNRHMARNTPYSDWFAELFQSS